MASGNEWIKSSTQIWQQGQERKDLREALVKFIGESKVRQRHRSRRAAGVRRRIGEAREWSKNNKYWGFILWGSINDFYFFSVISGRKAPWLWPQDWCFTIIFLKPSLRSQMEHAEKNTLYSSQVQDETSTVIKQNESICMVSYIVAKWLSWLTLKIMLIKGSWPFQYFSPKISTFFFPLSRSSDCCRGEGSR